MESNGGGGGGAGAAGGIIVNLVELVDWRANIILQDVQLYAGGGGGVWSPQSRTPGGLVVEEQVVQELQVQQEQLILVVEVVVEVSGVTCMVDQVVSGIVIVRGPSAVTFSAGLLEHQCQLTQVEINSYIHSYQEH